MRKIIIVLILLQTPLAMATYDISCRYFKVDDHHNIVRQGVIETFDTNYQEGMILQTAIKDLKAELTIIHLDDEEVRSLNGEVEKYNTRRVTFNLLDVRGEIRAQVYQFSIVHVKRRDLFSVATLSREDNKSYQYLVECQTL